MMNWLVRFIKGMLIGAGFILPGVSGGALAAVFGLYERMLDFLAHITKNTRENLLYFMPVGLGGLAGIFLISTALSYLFAAYEAHILWFFIGCISGTLPSLWRQAGQRRRKPAHIVFLAVTAVASFIGLRALAGGGISPEMNLLWWTASGGLIGLGMIVPGLSPSNFLVFFGIYPQLTEGFAHLNAGVLLPVFAGASICVLLLSKLMHTLLRYFYTSMFHVVLGLVIASTLMIMPRGANYHTNGLVFLATAVAGGIFGYWMGHLEDRYKLKEK